MNNISTDIIVLLNMYGNINKTETEIINLYEKGSISEKMMYAYIDELEKYGGK